MQKINKVSRKKIYKYYSDPGHAWLKVELKELFSLGIQNDISSCSYRRGLDCFLEEDCDINVFLSAKSKALNIPISDIKFDHYCNDHKQSKIRSYERYHIAELDKLKYSSVITPMEKSFLSNHIIIGRLK